MSKPENIVEFPDMKGIEAEAATWVAQLDSRGENGIDLDELSAWTAQSPQHSEAFERMATLWLGADVLDKLNYMDDAEEVRTHLNHRRTFARWATSIAASLVVGASVWLTHGIGAPEGVQTAAYATAVGEQQTITLADGSSVVMNTNSNIEIDLSETKRQITMVKGEAHFDVAHDPGHPFVVYARDGIVKAVGTAFTVQLHAETVEVTVSEGVVAILTPPDETARDDVTDIAIEDLTPIAALTVGDSAVIEEEMIDHVIRMSEDDLDRKLLWRGGFLAFAGEPLSTVVADVSRYTDILIEIDDPQLEHMPIGGYFKVGEVEDMLDSLEASFGVSVNRLSSSHVILTQSPD